MALTLCLALEAAFLSELDMPDQVTEGTEDREGERERGRVRFNTLKKGQQRVTIYEERNRIGKD